MGRRKLFDTVINRPYFHVKPLPAVQLHAWNSYVDYILTKEDVGTIVRLFERCLVACASYPGISKASVTFTQANLMVEFLRLVKTFCRMDTARQTCMVSG